MVGAPTKPTTVTVPVTNPTRESDGGNRGGNDGLCNSCADKLKKSNSETMSCPLKVSTDNESWCSCMFSFSVYLSKEEWYNGVGELLGLCLQGL